jgi:hypothetical protein
MNPETPPAPRLGAIPDKPDSRDYIRVTATAPVPDAFSLQEFGPQSPWNQGQVGACGGYAATAAIETLFGQLHPGKIWEPAPLYLYYKAREIGGTVDVDSGVQLRDMMKALTTCGVPPLFAHPTLRDWTLKPTSQADDLAGMLKIKDYQRVLVGPTAPDEIMKCLHQERLPLIIAINAFDTIYGKQVSYDGRIQLPGPNDKSLGYHALMLDSYDITTQTFGGWNSWGSGWGWGGRFSLPFEWFQRFDLVSDIWSFTSLYW